MSVCLAIACVWFVGSCDCATLGLEWEVAWLCIWEMASCLRLARHIGIRSSGEQVVDTIVVYGRRDYPHRIE